MGRGFWWEAKEGSGFEVKVRRELGKGHMGRGRGWHTPASWEGGWDGLRKKSESKYHRERSNKRRQGM